MGTSEKRIQCCIITGLTDSGKTTTLNSILDAMPKSDAFHVAVCRHHHAKAFGLETTPLTRQARVAHYFEVFDFGSGCICCSPDGDLMRGLQSLAAEQTVPITHLFIETTGVADPRPFIRLFSQECVESNFELGAVLCVINLVNGAERLTENLVFYQHECTYAWMHPSIDNTGCGDRCPARSSPKA